MGCMLVPTVVFGANELMKNINAVQDSTIKIKLNGENFTPKEADGTINYPIVYEGRTYLPVRSLAEAIKLPVDWDSATRTVVLGATEVANNVVVGRDQLFKPKDAQDKELMYYNSASEDLNVFDYPTSYTSGIIGDNQDKDTASKIGINTRGYKYLTGEINAEGLYTTYVGDETTKMTELKISVYTYDPITGTKGDKVGEIKSLSDKSKSFKVDVSGVSEVLLEVTSATTTPAYSVYNLVLGNVQLEK